MKPNHSRHAASPRFIGQWLPAFRVSALAAPRAFRGAEMILLWSLVTGFASNAASQDLRVGVSLGGAIPLGSFIDGFPLALKESGCAGGASDEPHLARLNFENDAGLSAGFHVLIGSVELGYSFSRHTWGPIDVTGFAYCLAENNALNNVFLDPKGLAEALGGEFNPRVIDDGDDVLQPLYVHRLLVGYRFYLWDGPWRPYIPFALGPTVMHGRDIDTLWGGSIQLGLGLEVEVLPSMIVGLDARYTADIMQNIALKSTSARSLVTQAGTGNESLFEAIFEVFQSIIVNATIGMRF